MADTPRTRIRSIFAQTAIVLIAMLVAVVAVEAAWRINYYYSLRNHVISQLLTVPTTKQPGDNSLYDPEMGYSYRPNMDGKAIINTFPVHFHTNSWGHVDNDEYPLAKPANEFRIVVVGDSFAAGVNNSVRWPTLLQENLNKEPRWHAAVGGKFTRVINAARDGIGLVQFDKVFFNDGMRFSPDLVILSFVTDDFSRKPYFRGILEMSPAQREQYVRDYAGKVVSRMPWWTPNPEVLALATGERWFRSRLKADIQVLNQDRRYADKDEGVRVSLAAVKAILARHPNVHLLLHPLYPEFKGEVPGHTAGSLEKFEQGLGGVHVEHMINRYPISYFPPGSDLQELNSWFMYPYDLHPSDKGLAMYAKYVTDYLLEQTDASKRLSTAGAVSPAEKATKK